MNTYQIWQNSPERANMAFSEWCEWTVLRQREDLAEALNAIQAIISSQQIAHLDERHREWANALIAAQELLKKHGRS